MLKRAVVFLALAFSACVKSSPFAWQCDESKESGAALVSILNENLTFESHVSNMSWWDEVAWKRAIDLWTVLSNYHDVISSQEPGVSRTSQELSLDLLHLTPAKLESTMEFMVKLITLYEPSRMFMAFNGGKDATVCLSLYVAALAHLTRNSDSQDRPKPRAVWFKAADEFDVVNKFVLEQVDYWDLDLTIVNGNWEDSLGHYLDHLSVKPHPLFVIGVRSSDLGEEERGATSSLQMSDLPSMAYMRAHPILDWDYGMVWDFMSLTGVPYCPLYDMGYSSIGKIGQSEPNQNLRSEDTNSLSEWKRASELCINAWGSERFGRGGSNGGDREEGNDREGGRGSSVEL